MVKAVSDSMVTLCLDLGYHFGLVDALLSYSEAKTSLEIAEDIGLKER